MHAQLITNIVTISSNIVNISGFEGHLVSVVTTQFCHGSGKAATDYVNECVLKLHLPKKKGRAALGSRAIIC